MTKHRIDVSYDLETKSPLHIGVGHGQAGLQRVMLRDQRGLPYIPGSTIKGRARYAAIRICEWMKLPVLKWAMDDGTDTSSPNGPSGKPDLPTRIFGSAWNRCTLRFADARTDPPVLDPKPNAEEHRVWRERAYGLREVRTGAARSRVLGTVSHQRLYRSELAPPNIVFRGSIAGYLSCDMERLSDSPAEIIVLWLALHLMVEDGIGGNKSAGSGKLGWATENRIVMKVDGVLFNPPDDEAASVLELLSSLEENRPGGLK